MNILGIGKDQLLSLMTEFESDPKKASMRVNQLWSWIYCHGISSFDNMTNVDKGLRSKMQKVLKIKFKNIFIDMIIEIQSSSSLAHTLL